MAGDKATTDGSITTSDGIVMTKNDVEFLITCIQNTTGGQLLIDQVGVANALGMKNVRSVGNKVSLMKKKYGLPLGTGSGKASGGEPSSPAVPKTTKTDKITKSTPKKKAATSAKQLKAQAVKEESEEEGDDTQEVEQEDVCEAVSADEDAEEEHEVEED